MSAVHRPVARAAMAAIVMIFVQPASYARAQGFFQNLFGFGVAPAVQQRSAGPSGTDHYRQPVSPPAIFTPDGRENSTNRAETSGKYRTLCVRMCDGYYFPISASVSRREFHRDASQCRSQCGTEARLFYHSSASGDAAAMVDVTGRAYSKLPNAFRYRKTLVDGCKCKPEPWAESELNRHQGYASAEVAKSEVAPPSTGKSHGPAADVIAGHDKGPVALELKGALPTTAVAATVTRVGAEPIARAAILPTPIGEAAATANTEKRKDTGDAQVAPSVASTAKPKAGKLRSQSKGLDGPLQPINHAAVAPSAATRGSTQPRVAPPPRAKPAPTGLFGLGGQQLKWPGD